MDQDLAGSLLNSPSREFRVNDYEYRWETDMDDHVWRDVYVFISSTFNDMQAERNYLVKRVFPELAQWCAERHLRLRDIDLRWGITEEDSMENLRTVQICLENVDRCRPFFLCLIGQRRGWVPSERDIAAGTFEDFPGLKERIGSSVTEMEVIHSLIDPMRRVDLPEQDVLERAFFYLRDPSFLTDVNSQEILNIYTNAASDDPAREDEFLRKFREETLPETGRPCRVYSGKWDPDGKTPELAAIPGASPEIVNGGLTDLTCGGRPLAESILKDLKEAIVERYDVPEVLAAGSRLEKELEEQSRFLWECEEGFIEREGDLGIFEDYLLDDSSAPLILTGRAGSGKSSLLAHWICNSEYRIYYRFIGRSEDSAAASATAHSIWQQLYEEGKVNGIPPEDPAVLLEDFGKMLGEAAKEKALILVLDAIDQWPGRTADARFLPQMLPEGVKMILSVREDSPGADRFLEEAAFYAIIVRARPFEGIDDRNALVEAYLSSYLKQLGHDAQQALVTAPGAENPLYLKIVLNELRIFGAHSKLRGHIEHDFGNTPVEAFDAMLMRLESDAETSRIPMRELVRNVFGWLAHARYGLSAEELGQLLTGKGISKDTAEAVDSVRMLFRQLRPFLTERELRTDFFYDSFRQACLERYLMDKNDAAWHGELADCFSRMAMTDPHRLSEQAYQYVRADRIPEYLEYVFEYAYVSGKLAAHGLQALAEDYRLHVTDETARMASFLGLAGPVLAAEPDQLINRLYGHFAGCDAPAIQRLLREGAAAQKDSWLRPLIPCFTEPRTGTAAVMETREEMSANAVLLRNDTLAAAILSQQTILIWDLSTGQIELRIPAESGRRFLAIRGTPDGNRLIIMANQTDSLREEDNGRWILVYETGGFTCVNRFRVGGRDIAYRHYRIYHIRDNRFEVLPDGRSLVISDDTGILRIYDLETGDVRAETEYEWNANEFAAAKTGRIAVANIHPKNGDDRYDDDHFWRGPNPVYLLQYDAESGKLSFCGDPLGGLSATVEAVALSGDGTRMAISDLFGVCVFDTETGSLLADLNLARIRVLRFLSGDRLLTAGRTIRIYDLSDPEEPHLIREMTGLGYCNGVCVSADESFLTVRIDDRKLRVISLDGDTEFLTGKAGAPVPVRSVSLAPGGAYVFGSGYPNYIERGYERTAGKTDEPFLFVFDRTTGALMGQLTLAGMENRDFVSLTPDGTMAAARRFQEQGKVTYRRWMLPKPEIPLQEGMRTGEERVHGSSSTEQFSVRYSTDFPENYQFTADRHYLVIKLGPESRASVHCADRTTGPAGRVQFELPASGLRKLFRPKPQFDDLAMANALFDVTDAGKTLVVLFNNSEKPRIERFALPSGKCLSSTPLADGPVSSYGSVLNVLCQVVSGGSRLAVVTAGAAAVLEIETGKRVFYLDKETAQCESADYFGACSPDGKLLAISGQKDYRDSDWRIQLWDVEKAERIGTFVADGVIGEMRFEEDGRTLVFGMGNGRICRLAAELL